MQIRKGPGHTCCMRAESAGLWVNESNLQTTESSQLLIFIHKVRVSLQSIDFYLPNIDCKDYSVMPLSTAASSTKGMYLSA